MQIINEKFSLCTALLPGGSITESTQLQSYIQIISMHKPDFL